VKLFLPIFKMNFPEIVDIALPAEGVFHNLVFVSIRKTYPMQAYKIMHGLWNEADDPATAGPNISWWWTTTWTCTTPAKSSFASAPTPIPSEIQFSQKGLLMFWTMQRLKWQSEQSWALTPRGRSREKNSKGWGLC
jgi:hypothetical protein